jgi:hypothetical protein
MLFLFVIVIRKMVEASARYSVNQDGYVSSVPQYLHTLDQSSAFVSVLTDAASEAVHQAFGSGSSDSEQNTSNTTAGLAMASTLALFKDFFGSAFVVLSPILQCVVYLVDGVKWAMANGVLIARTFVVILLAVMTGQLLSLLIRHFRRPVVQQPQQQQQAAATTSFQTQLLSRLGVGQTLVRQ